MFPETAALAGDLLVRIIFVAIAIIDISAYDAMALVSCDFLLV